MYNGRCVSKDPRYLIRGELDEDAMVVNIYLQFGKTHGLA